MNSPKASRPIPLALTALVAMFSATAALMVSSGHAHAQNTMHAVHAGASTTSQALKADMRELWSDHVMWTRLAIISLTTKAPDAQATIARLLRNQVQIGDAIKPFYGVAAGNALTGLLHSHILIAADVIAAAQAGDKAKLAGAQARWMRNADSIAAFLHRANPHAWPLATMKAEMHMHLNLTAAEVVDRLQGKWGADVAAYDRVVRHILHMSDVLSAGLVQQFPGRFEG